MLGFRIRYLRGSVTAADVRTGSDKDQVEWPPHPDRLFCALVQAWADLGCPDHGRRALEWLEALRPPPSLRFGEPLSTRMVFHYVPVNDRWSPLNKTGDKAAPRFEGSALGRIRQPRTFAYAPLAEDTVWLWWPSALPTDEQRNSLRILAQGVSSLGHSSSFVSVEPFDSDSDLEPTLAPAEDGDYLLRIPTPGRLNTLREAYLAQRRPPPGEWAVYAQPSQDIAPARGYHRELIIFRLSSEQWPSLPLECSARLTSTWRAALISKASQPVPEVISGHAPDSTPTAPKPSQRPHLALLPLADVGHRFARGHLLGLAAALPVGLTPQERRECLRALGQVQSLTLGDLGVWRLERVDASELRWALRAETWRRPSALWASVTPVVFGRFPKSLWGDEAAEMIAEACQIAGLPRPCEVSTAPVSWVLGVPPSYRFAPLTGRPNKPRRAHAHVRLRFSAPVAGPLLVGAGRHLGYGLFRQIDKEVA
ncbi:MAG: type I-U CRISPR-associated protein Cas5/Cas6 [Bryobacteraceae bacterium]|nr:type I-U CRISPR-associated protein Cas5/Cas6 [Bryobacteraceae bacterium]